MQASGCRHVDQGIYGKQADLAAHEIGDTRLRDAEQLGGLRLAQSRGAQPGLTVAAGALLGFLLTLTSVGAGALGVVMLAIVGGKLLLQG